MPKPVAFSRNYARRIIDKVDGANSLPDVTRYPLSDCLSCIVDCAEGCTAGDADSPGTGTGVVQVINDLGEYEAYGQPDGNQLELTFYNITQQALDSGKMFLMRHSFTDHWIVVVADC